MLQKEIRNIVFDLGGVLCGLDAQRCVEAFHRIGAQRIAYYVEEHRVEDLFLEAELGTITTGVFCDRVRSIVGQPVPDDDIVWAWNELLTGVSRARLEALCRLAGKYRLFLLSNTNVMHWAKCKEEYFRTSVCGHTLSAENLFQRIYLSFELHLAKPSTEIFQHVLDDAGLLPSQTLFIDDSQANVRAASQLGMLTYHNKNIDDWLTLIG